MAYYYPSGTVSPRSANICSSPVTRPRTAFLTTSSVQNKRPRARYRKAGGGPSPEYPGWSRPSCSRCRTTRWPSRWPKRLWRPARMCCVSTRRRATPSGRRRSSTTCARTMAIPSRSARAMSSTATASLSRQGGRGFRQGRHRRRLHLHHARNRVSAAAKATAALIEVSAARGKYFRKTGVYVPICSDSGIVHDYHDARAPWAPGLPDAGPLRFARFGRSPTNKL